jgi:pimeloyl-ACP methyl ester carboxylesterase
VLELSNIKNESSLAEQPLQISVPKIEGEVVFPFTIETVLSAQEDGSYVEELLVWPIGTPTGVDDAGNNLYEIQTLPSYSNKGTRSLGKVLKMSFAKVVMQQDKEALSWVDYTQEGYRDSEGVKEKVAEANTILIALHGIMGDTSIMVQNLEFAQAYYDLILTFDYESLNTAIQDTASSFKSKLTAVGIHEGGAQKVDLVAFGMGGLVARAFIESPDLRGDKVCNNLYMLGTPNAGSAFSKIAAYRDLLVTGLTFALNFQAPAIGAIAKLITGLTVSKKLTVTLEQMSEGSSFLQALNNHAKPSNVQYYILAGSTKNYQSKANKRLAKLTEWAAIKMGQLFYGNKENDMVVATDSIVGVPEYFDAITQQIDGHHLVYFVDQQSIAILESWMKDNSTQ